MTQIRGLFNRVKTKKGERLDLRFCAPKAGRLALTGISMLCYNLHAGQGQMLRSVGCLQSVWAVVWRAVHAVHSPLEFR